MATEGKNLSTYSRAETPSAAPFTFGVVVSEWNEQITDGLAKGAVDTLRELGADESNIHFHFVPGTYELALGSQMLIEAKKVDAVVAIGSVIQGETRHFDFVCEAAAQGIKDVSLKTGVPVIFCVLTDNTMQQAIDRSGGLHGNKGVEAAVAAVKMAQLKKTLG